MIFLILLAYVVSPVSNPVDWRFPSLNYRILERLETMAGNNFWFTNFKPLSVSKYSKILSNQMDGQRDGLELKSFLNLSGRDYFQNNNHYLSYLEWGFNGKLSMFHNHWQIEDEFVFFSKRSKDFDLPYYDPLNDYRRKLYILKGEPAIGMASFFDLRMIKAYTELNYKNTIFRMGRFNLRIGPGYSSNFLFSGVNQPLDFLYYVESGYKRFLHFLVLNASVPDTVEGKRVAYQRLEINPISWLSLAFSEGVMYTRQDLLKYINPFDFFYLIQRHSKDNQDNLVAEGNLTIYWPHRTKVYFIFFDDDWIVTPEDNQASLYGYTLGIFHVNPFGCKGLDVRVEYTEVSPWTYAHFSRTNSWAVNNTPLGNWAGNDFKHIFIEVGYVRDLCTFVSLDFEYLEHGLGNLESPWEFSHMPGNLNWPIPPINKTKYFYTMFVKEMKSLSFAAKVGFSVKGNNFSPFLSTNLKFYIPYTFKI